MRAHDLLDSRLAESLYAMAGFRNILVHGYQRVDLAVVRDIVRNHLEDLLAYAAAVRASV
ncbi:uncharacterized protein YutE (UPF0331/DUF86 family) [Natronocella acetinitrilica]|uniref:Uncharacterized protein YutE (UPF0331/DUF86 family) n=2 Tax=Natronocella acetinitrilica TaxID=414046 RepID=A0AAE3G2U0_9GAMM|nr:uncharacterized protein YutE (UPF0331/DUF86 family) [Natronocella acetinitrilica]